MPVDTLEQGNATAFNFSRAGLIANDQLRALRALDEQFARNLTHTLGAWLRTNATLTPGPAAQMSFSQFTENTSTGCYVMPLRMEPMRVRAALSMELKLAPIVIDILLGGSGRTGGSERELTEIEEAVLASVMDIVLREWTAAWAMFGVEFVAEQRDGESHGKRIMPLQEKTLVVRFTLGVADASGDLLFCLPSAQVVSIMKAMSHARSRQQSIPADRQRMEDRIRDAALKVQLQLPSMRLYTRDLRHLREGALLHLPLLRNAPAELRVGGVAIYRAQPVRSTDHRAARLVQLLDSPERKGGEEHE